MTFPTNPQLTSCSADSQQHLISPSSKMPQNSFSPRLKIPLISFTYDLCVYKGGKKMFFPYSACLFPVLPDTCENGPSSCCCCVCKGREFKSKDFFFPFRGHTKKMWNFRHECQRMPEKMFFTRKDKFLVILTYRIDWRINRNHLRNSVFIWKRAF